MNYNKSLKDIKKDIEILFNVEDISIKSKTRISAMYRYLYFHLAKKFTKKVSLVAIGKEVKRDHSTVIYGLNNINNLLKYYPSIRKGRQLLIDKYNDELLKDLLVIEGEVIRVNLVRNELIIK